MTSTLFMLTWSKLKKSSALTKYNIASHYVEVSINHHHQGVEYYFQRSFDQMLCNCVEIT